MSSYKQFAYYYDRLTENVDYKVRGDYISNFFSDCGNGGNSLLDLACGTGTFTKYFADKGYNVCGIDLSEDMLTIAQSKLSGSATLLNADITSFDFESDFDYCICMLDSINHLQNISAVKKCFDCVYNSLKSGGLFIFDVNTPYKHNFILADNTFVFDEEDFFLSWDNELTEENKVRIMLDLFVYNGSNYDRYSEEFYETAYTINELKELLTAFELVGIYDDLTLDEPVNSSERVYFVLKRK